MEVTLSGMMIFLRLEQPENALTSIEVTLSGMVTAVSREQFENALSLMTAIP